MYFSKQVGDPAAADAQRVNEFGQPIGPDVSLALPAPAPARVTLEGNSVRLEPLDPERHGAALFAAFTAGDDSDWTYMAVGPFVTAAEYLDWAVPASQAQDPLQFAVVSRATGDAVGTLSLMRQDPANAVVEVGAVSFSRAMQRTAMSTETHYLLMQYVFDGLGYRRYEWKCDSLNAPSVRAAGRLGFGFEGTFRHAVVYKGRSRDTSWFSIVSAEWPALRAEYERWLAPENFDAAGNQLTPLRANG